RMVSPSATRAARTSEADARRSEHMTAADWSEDLPRTVAVRPETVMLAPMRLSSPTCMKRFSKMFSVMEVVPSVWVARAMYWACMSVGKPGYSSVEPSEALRAPSIAPADRTRMLSWPTMSLTPHCSSLEMRAPRWEGGQQSTLRSPPGLALAMRKVPASMRSELIL